MAQTTDYEKSAEFKEDFGNHSLQEIAAKEVAADKGTFVEDKTMTEPLFSWWQNLRQPNKEE